MRKDVRVRETPITLGQFLKLVGVGDTGGQAKSLIEAGNVEVNGEVETRRGRKLQLDDEVAFGETIYILKG
jgi:ribosome-associated protein